HPCSQHSTRWPEVSERFTPLVADDTEGCAPSSDLEVSRSRIASCHPSLLSQLSCQYSSCWSGGDPQSIRIASIMSALDWASTSRSEMAAILSAQAESPPCDPWGRPDHMGSCWKTPASPGRFSKMTPPGL